MTQKRVLHPVLAATACVVALALHLPTVLAEEQAVGIPSVLILDPGEKNGALSLNGGSRLIVHKGNVIVNSTSQSALSNQLATIQVLDGDIGLAGNFQNLGKAVTKPTPRRATQFANPYTKLKLPTVANVVSAKQKFIRAGVPETLSPGRYEGGLNIGKGAEVTMKPGVYLISNGDFFTSEATLTGEGVTIIMWGAKPGKLLFSKGSKINLSAPEDGDLKGMLILSAGKVQKAESQVGFNGCTAELNGVVDVPMGRVGVFFEAHVKVTRVVAHWMTLNVKAVLEVTGDDGGVVPQAEGDPQV